ncbi:MAG TPA: ribonuclease P protein subunit [Candidatus Nanoarchaeia archaeon]|nr:ribonuclease P protein subunit [Candidatus Nanoarchaeia archaeon]
MKQGKYHRLEFIGKDVKIIESENRKNIGIHGKVIDETKNTFMIKTNDDKNSKKRLLRIIKNQNTFEFAIEGKKMMINGNEILKRPEERIKI